MVPLLPDDADGSVAISNRTKTVVRTSAKILASICIVYLLIAFEILHFSELHALLQPENALLVLAMMLTQLAGYFFYSVRWGYLICHLGATVSMEQSIVTGFRGLFTQLFIPGGLGLEGVRVIEMQRSGAANLADTVASLSTDRIVGFAALFLLGSVLIGALAFQTETPLLGLFFYAVATVSLLLVVTYFAVRNRADFFDTLYWRSRWSNAIARTFTSIASYTQSSRLVLGMLMLAVVGHLLTCFVFYLGAMVLNLQIQLLPVLALATIVVLARSVPFAPMGLGVVDVTSELIFDLVGSDAGAELAMTVRGVNVVLLGLCGVAFFFRGARN